MVRSILSEKFPCPRTRRENQTHNFSVDDDRETTSAIALNAAGHGMKHTASEISMVSSGSNKFPAVKHVQFPSYDTVQQEGVMYVQAPSRAHVMTAMAPPG